MTTEQGKVSFFKKGKSRPTTSRRRSLSPAATQQSVNDLPSKSQVILPSRKATTTLLTAGSKRTTSQRDEFGDQPEKEGPDVKWTASGSHVNAALDILAGDEAEELLERRMKKSKEDAGDSQEDAPDDGIYRGQQAYRSHLKKSKDVPKAMRVGPQRSTNTIRTVTIVDYQPDVCKDYKETGYCGFGDTCKFLHDRGTYLAGWQLDKLAENPKRTVEEASDSDSDEDIPFACLICRKPFTTPVVTRCQHYFCSACAIKRFAKTPKCAACGAPTGGIFNRADKIFEKMNKKKKEKEGGEVMDLDQQGGGNGEIQIEGLHAESGGEDEE